MARVDWLFVETSTGDYQLQSPQQSWQKIATVARSTGISGEKRIVYSVPTSSGLTDNRQLRQGAVAYLFLIG